VTKRGGGKNESKTVTQWERPKTPMTTELGRGKTFLFNRMDCFSHRWEEKKGRGKKPVLITRDNTAPGDGKLNAKENKM